MRTVICAKCHNPVDKLLFCRSCQKFLTFTELSVEITPNLTPQNMPPTYLKVVARPIQQYHVIVEVYDPIEGKLINSRTVYKTIDLDDAFTSVQNAVEDMKRDFGANMVKEKVKVWRSPLLWLELN